jgi:phage terminase small subunit
MATKKMAKARAARKRRAPGGEMTDRKRLFVKEYLVDLNATQAALRAGYSAKTANAQGGRLLRDVSVRTAIENGKAARADRLAVSADRVIKELARIAFGDPRDVMSWGPDGVALKDSSALEDDEAMQVAEVSQTTSATGGSLKLKKHDKVKALELLGRHIGMWNDKLDIGLHTVTIKDYTGRS